MPQTLCIMGIPGDAKTEVKGAGTKYLDGVVVEHYGEGGESYAWTARRSHICIY